MHRLNGKHRLPGLVMVLPPLYLAAPRKVDRDRLGLAGPSQRFTLDGRRVAVGHPGQRGLLVGPRFGWAGAVLRVNHSFVLLRLYQGPADPAGDGAL